MPAYATFLRNARLTTAPKGILSFAGPLYAQIVDITASVADACEKKTSSSDPEILKQLDRMGDPEQATAFYNRHRDEIHRAFEVRNNSYNS